MKKKILSCIFLFTAIFLHAQEICNNGIDDDGDGLIDCYDPDCGGKLVCDSFFYNHPLVYCKLIPVVKPTFTLDLLWSSPISVDTRQTIIVGDLNADGKPEVLCYDLSNKMLTVLNGQTGALKQTITTPVTSTQYDGPAMADVDRDGQVEMYIITDDNFLRCYEPNGLPKPGFTPTLTIGNREHTESIADFDGDGIPEVYVDNQIYNSLTGALIVSAGVAASIGGNTAAYPVAADVLPTGFCPDCAGLELVCGNQVYSVNITTATMTLVSTAPAGLKDGYTSIADYNKDGKLDVIVVSKGIVYVWDPRTGLQFGSTYTIPGTNNGGQANVADYDNDGFPEIGFGGKNIYVVLNDFNSGGPTLKWSKVIVDGSGETTCTSFDFEGDGKIEIIYRDEGTLFIWDGATGNVKASTPCGSGTRTEYPTVVDVDANGQANIVCTCAATSGAGPGVVKAFRSKTQPWVSTRKVMNQHSYFAVNINDNLTIPANQQNHALITPLNTFLNQPPVTDNSGNPIFIPAADVIANIDTVIFSTCSNPNTVNVTLTFCDTGYVSAPKGMNVSFYNGNPLAGGTLIVTDSTANPITVKGCITQTFTIPYSGPFNLYVYANDKGTNPAKAPELSFIECDSLNNFDNISIAASPVFSLTTSFIRPTCNGLKNGSATVSVTGNTSPYSYVWSTTPLQINNTATNLPAGTYICTVTDVNGCTATSSITITQPTTLSTNIVSSTNITCNGKNNGVATTTNTGGIGPYTYSWNTIPIQTTITANNLSAGTYTFTVTDINSCIAATTVTITQPPLLSLSISGIDITCNGACNGQTIVIPSGGTIPYSYNWSGGCSSPACSNLCPATYTITVTDAMGCIAVGDTTITEFPPVIATISGVTTICIGQSTTLTATGGGSYSWSSGDLTATTTVTPAGTTTYTVTITNGSCTATATTQVRVSNLIPVITGLTTICDGASTALSVSGGGTYLWNDGSTSMSINANPTVSTTYSVTVTNGICIGTASQAITVNPNPMPTISGTAIICSGQSTILTANAGGTYSWNTGASTAVITVSPTNTTMYFVTVTISGCSGSATMQVIVNPIPAPIITGVTSICSGKSTTLTSSTGGPYIWNTGATTASITVMPAVTTNYSLNVTINSCTGTAMQTVTVVPPVIAKITSNNICVGDNVILTASGGTTYLWNTGTTTNPLTDNPITTTSYTVIASSGNCTDTTTYTVIVNPLPTVTATGNATISYGNSTPLKSIGSGKYSWIPPTGLSCSDCANPIATPTATTQYCVVIKDSIGCSDSACVTVTLDLKCGDNGELFVPNGFSPNGDGQNDILYVRGAGVVEMYWVIYDRWGEKVFETTNPKHGWDGTYHGKQLDPAVFVYYLKVTCFSGNEITQKGNVAIIK